MGAPLTRLLAAGDDPIAPELNTPWIEPDALAFADANSSVDLDLVCRVASEILFILSGRQYGVRTETTRPHIGDRTCGWARFPDGSWSERIDRLDRIDSNCGGPNWLLLKSPVARIDSVKVDGVELDASEYRLYDNRRLLRNPDALGNVLSWPLNQRLDLDDSEAGTFSVTYQWGKAVTDSAKLAAQVFATELCKYINNDSDCAIADRALTVSRQGVTVQTIDPRDFINAARTGINFVDTWLATVNPRGRQRRPTITGPDSVILERVT